MKPIELTRIRNNGYQFEETITFQKEIYENTDIRDLKNLVVKGEITKTLDQDLFLSAHLTGQMKLTSKKKLLKRTKKLLNISKKTKIHLILWEFYGRILFWKFLLVFL